MPRPTRYLPTAAGLALVLALAMPATAAASRAEKACPVSTTSTSYVNLGGPSVTVNITSAGTPVTIWLYAQAMQTPILSGQTAWFEVVDNGSEIWQSYWNDTNAGWGDGLWAAPNAANGTTQNITEALGTFTPSPGAHTYQVLYRETETGNTVSWRFRTLVVRVGNSTLPAPNLTHPTTAATPWFCSL